MPQKKKRMKFMENTKKKKKNKKGIILLSSGLDSYISLSEAIKTVDVVLALTFDYGQKAAKDEIEAAKKIADKYNIEHKTITLPFLKEITNNSLTNENKNLEFDELGINSMKAVWVPNRNGLFLNIAAMYCDAVDCDYIIFGANKEEAGTFSDNSLEFNNIANKFFKYSTLKHPEILSPVANLEKREIVNLGIKNNVDFSLLKSCYNSFEKSGKNHCGKCESCKRLYNAILKSNDKSLINLIF